MKYFLIAVLTVGWLFSFGQELPEEDPADPNYSEYFETCYSTCCVRNISTNPANPYNDEWTNYFPSDPGNMVNTGFSWYPLDNIYLNPDYFNNISWITPNGYQMQWPFSSGHNGHTHLTGGGVADRDFRWEDGWELLYLNTGFLANGDAWDDKQTGSWNECPLSELWLQITYLK